MAYRLAAPAVLQNIVRQQKLGIPVGIASLCTAHPVVLEACLREALKTGGMLLIEATCNQVNQFGGYTGQTPADFAAYVIELASRNHFPLDQLLLGGDHLGPYPWRKEPSASAMAKSTQLIKDYLAAGFRKIHIDTSMPCLDDPATGLKLSSAARRTVELCSVAEQAARSNPQYPKPVYVIGSEVPSPGGAAEAEESIKVTEMRAAAQTLELFAREFAEAGLQEAWERVIALVVQPGVEFGDEHILAYDRSKCEALLGFIQQVPGIVFEAHSTDYQPAVALRQMVEDQFAVLKVGPALTFAYRQVMLALEDMEQTWLGRRSEVNLSRLKQTLLEAMREEPVHWENYYHGSSQEVEFKQIYSYSDRIRYYWRASEIQTALQRLLANLRQFPPPLPLVSQYLPVQWAHIQNGALGLDPQDWIWDGVQSAWSVYVAACYELSGS